MNAAFIIDQSTGDRLIAESPRSVEIIKPILRGRDVGRYRLPSAIQWLIKVETGWTRKAMGEKGKVPESQAWNYFAQRYPAVAAYLEPFAERARKRDDQGQFWWELRPCVYYSELEGPKIIYPDIAPNAEFSFDTKGIYIEATLFCIPTEQKYLTAVLNSLLLDFLLMRIAPAIRGGYYRYKTLYIEQLPIVEPNQENQARLAALVDRLQALGGQGPDAKALEREVDAIIYQTYDLCEEEIAEIERWHAERRAQLGAGRRGQRIIANEEAEEVEA